MALNRTTATEAAYKLNQSEIQLFLHRVIITQQKNVIFKTSGGTTFTFLTKPEKKGGEYG